MSDAPATADLCDQHGGDVIVVSPIFRDFGGIAAFCGAMATVRCADDNSKVREALSSAGDGRVLVVDGGGSQRCALLGDNLAQLAIDNGWRGIVVHGCVRDAVALAALPIGVKATATCPRRSAKKGTGEVNAVLRFAAAEFAPGHFLYADNDGIVLSPRAL